MRKGRPMRFKSRGSSLLSRRVSIRKTASAVPVGGQRGCRTSERPGGNRPIAAILTAFSPSRRSRHYALAAIASVGPRMAIPSGRLPVCQLNLWPDSRFGEKGLALQTRSPAPSHDFRTGSQTFAQCMKSIYLRPPQRTAKKHAVDCMKNPGSRFSTALL